MPRRIKIIDWIIPTIREHIVPQEALSGAAVGVCVEEALDNGVVISGLEVIEVRLSRMILPASSKMVVWSLCNGVRATGVFRFLRYGLRSKNVLLFIILYLLDNYNSNSPKDSTASDFFALEPH